MLVRHGLSTYNDQNRFTGWKDVPLNAQGIAEAEQAVLWWVDGLNRLFGDGSTDFPRADRLARGAAALVSSERIIQQAYQNPAPAIRTAIGLRW